MSTKPVPQALPIRDAMGLSAPLARLAERLRDSNSRFEAVTGVLPAALRKSVRPGPVDEEGWSLVAANAAVAAKLRHLIPTLDQTLQNRGWTSIPIRVKIASPR
jgi:hypothetical protein